MRLHRITAGHGYTYLTRQVAVQDGSVVPGGGIGAYYAEAGESPGRWAGAGLGSLGLNAGDPVSEPQMVALFGEGRHPDAAAIAAELAAEGAEPEAIEAATNLGRPFVLNPASGEFRRQVAQLLLDWNTARGLPACAPARPREPSQVTARADGRAVMGLARSLAGHLGIARSRTTVRWWRRSG